MELIIGKTAGFCSGVKRAVETAKKELEEKKEKIFCLGEIVHNKQVVQKLEDKGLIFIEKIEDSKGETIIRAHGISREVYEKANKMNLTLIDLTCPKVLETHKLAEDYSNLGYFIVLIGIENHPESIGTISFCGKNSYLLTDVEKLKNCVKEIQKTKIKKVFILAQTTYSLKKFDKIVNEFKNFLGKEYEVEVKNTICPATRYRQEETEKISKEVDYMIIIGGKNSSNTRKLFEISKINCDNAILVETAKDINIEEIKNYEKIGIMAGASTPKESIEEIEKLINEGVKDEVTYCNG